MFVIPRVYIRDNTQTSIKSELHRGNSSSCRHEMHINNWFDQKHDLLFFIWSWPLLKKNLLSLYLSRSRLILNINSFGMLAWKFRINKLGKPEMITISSVLARQANNNKYFLHANKKGIANSLFSFFKALFHKILINSTNS